MTTDDTQDITISDAEPEAYPPEWEAFSPRQRAFLAALPVYGSVSAACRALAPAGGHSRRHVYDWCAQDPDFRDAFAQAKETAADMLEAALYRRAHAEAGMPGVVSSIFLLKTWRPEYRDNITVEHKGTITQVQVDLARLSPEDRARILTLAAEHAQQRLGASHPADGDTVEG